MLFEGGRSFIYEELKETKRDQKKEKKVSFYQSQSPHLLLFFQNNFMCSLKVLTNLIA